MACKVALDCCSGCGNKARNRSEYCDESNCKYGGLKHNMSKVAADGHMLHADNPDPSFFDISNVYRPADRIAYVLGHAKAASGKVLGGAELAEMWGLYSPLDALLGSMEPAVAATIKLAHVLADIEVRIARQPESIRDDVSRALVRQAPMEGVEIFAKLASFRDQALAALTERKTPLPVREFLLLHAQDASKAEKVAQLLPGIYSRLVASETLETDVRANRFRLSNESSAEARRWSEKQAQDHSLQDQKVRERVLLSALRQEEVPRLRPLEKQASADATTEALAKRYAFYKLAFLERCLAFDHPRTVSLEEMAVRQNYLTA
jgi:hypothetical protein